MYLPARGGHRTEHGVRRNDKLDIVRSLLQSQTTLVLASVGDDGLPRSTPLFYLCEGDLRLCWFSSRTSLHSRNCAARPETSVCVAADARTWRQIRGTQMQGRVALVNDRTRRKAITAAYMERFALTRLFAMAIRRSSLYCFTPRWIRYIDNTKRFGYRFEIDLAASDSTDRASPGGST